MGKWVKSSYLKTVFAESGIWSSFILLSTKSALESNSVLSALESNSVLSALESNSVLSAFNDNASVIEVDKFEIDSKADLVDNKIKDEIDFLIASVSVLIASLCTKSVESSITSIAFLLAAVPKVGFSLI